MKFFGLRGREPAAGPRSDGRPIGTFNAAPGDRHGYARRRCGRCRPYAVGSGLPSTHPCARFRAAAPGSLRQNRGGSSSVGRSSIQMTHCGASIGHGRWPAALGCRGGCYHAAVRDCAAARRRRNPLSLRSGCGWTASLGGWRFVDRALWRERRWRRRWFGRVNVPNRCPVQ